MIDEWGGGEDAEPAACPVLEDRAAGACVPGTLGAVGDPLEDLAERGWLFVVFTGPDVACAVGAGTVAGLVVGIGVFGAAGAVVTGGAGAFGVVVVCGGGGGGVARTGAVTVTTGAVTVGMLTVGTGTVGTGTVGTGTVGRGLVGAGTVGTGADTVGTGGSPAPPAEAADRNTPASAATTRRHQLTASQRSREGKWLRPTASGKEGGVTISDDWATPPADPQDWALQLETCRIVLAPGYLTAQFYARGEDGGTLAVCEPSATFRWRGRNPPDTDEARLAHYELVARLKGEGWAQTGKGEEWYASTFTRSILVPRIDEEEDLEPDAEEVELPPREPTALPAPPPQPQAVAPPLPQRPPRSASSRDWPRHIAALGLALALALLIWLLVYG